MAPPRPNAGFGGQVEMRGGIITEPSGRDRAELATIIVLAAGARLEGRRGTLTGSYRPRMRLDWFSRWALRHPPIYHQFQLDGIYRPNRRLETSISGSGGYGQLDYVAQALALGEAQTSRIDVPITTAYVANLDARATYALTRRTGLDAGLSGEYGGIADIEGGDEDPFIPFGRTRVRGTANLGYRFTWTPRTQISLGVSGTYYYFIELSQIAMATAFLAWAYQLTPRAQISAQAGAAYAATLEYSPPPEHEIVGEPAPHTVNAIAQLSLRGTFFQRRGTALNGDLSATFAPFVDPLTSSLTQRLASTATLSLTTGRSWQFNLAATLATPLRSAATRPVMPPPGTGLAETLFSGSFGVGKDLGEYATINFGATTNLRGPDLGTRDFKWTSTDVFAQIGIRTAVDVFGRGARWVQ